MGLLFARFRPALAAVQPTVPALVIPQRRKRKIQKEQTASDEVLYKRMKMTGKYIYGKLFLQGEGSDINIHMLDKDWKLHRLYIQQCGYFRSMLSGCWTEGRQDSVVVEIVDPNITLDALHIALGCLYFGDRDLNPDNVVGVLATAMFLQIPGLIKACEKTMMDNINLVTVIDFFTASTEYCMSNAIRSCHTWLLLNLTSTFKSRKHLRKLSASLLYKLLSDDKLFVIHSEMTLYLLLRDWIFHQIHETFDEVEPSSTPESYFRKSKQPLHELLGKDLIPADNGVTIEDIISSLRLSDLLTSTPDAQMLLEDGIFSEQRVFEQGFYNLQQLLFINQRMDRGIPLPLRDDIFEKYCVRHGRIVADSKKATWRWNGFKYGMDLNIAHEEHSLRLKWNTSGQYGVIVNNQTRRKFVYQLSYASVNSMLQPLHTVSLPRKYLSLFPNTEITLTNLPKETTYPLLVSLKFCITTYKHVMDMMNEVHPPPEQ